MMGRVIVVTGQRGVGKTTVCRQTVRLAQQRGYTCGGILTLAESGVRHVLDVRTGRRRRLTTASDGGRAVTQGRFRFNPQTLVWGSRLLTQATPCDLLVVDEVGPLEIERGKGWMTAFDVLQARRYALALLVVRPELVAQACDRLIHASLKVLNVTQENRACLPISLIALIEREAMSA